MLNNNTPSSAPPPPPPPPPPGWKNTDKHNDKDGKSPSVTAEKSSSGTQLKRGLSEVSSPKFLKELKNNSKFKETNNASDKTKNDRSNTKQVVPKKPMTGQHNGVQSDNDKSEKVKCKNENQKSSVAEQKKAPDLKYSIAILLLFTSSAAAGAFTYYTISTVLSGAAVPVFFPVIASVSALVMLISAAYLINSHLSAINRERKVDPGRKQPQNLQKAKGLEHSNTPTSSLPVTPGTPSAPPTLKNNTTNKSIPSGGGKQQESGDLMAELSKAVKKQRTVVSGEDGAQQRNNEVCQNQPQYSGLQEAKKLEHSNSDTTTGPIRKVENQKTDKEPSNSEGTQQMDSLAIVIQKHSPSNNLLSNSSNVADSGDWETQPDSIQCTYRDRTRQEIRQEKKEKAASPSATKGSGADQVSNEVQESSTVSVKEQIKKFQGLNK